MKGGHGRTTRAGQVMYAHRAAYIDAYGPIPDDWDVHHKCEVKLCVEPTHLMAQEKVEHRTPNLMRWRGL